MSMSLLSQAFSNSIIEKHHPVPECLADHNSIQYCHMASKDHHMSIFLIYKEIRPKGVLTYESHMYSIARIYLRPSV